MDKMSKTLMSDLLLTKAMADYSLREERFDSLNDVIDEVFSDGALDRENYLHSIMKLTQLGYVASDIESEEDIEMSEAVGYDIVGLTAKGINFINGLMEDKTWGDKVKDFFVKFDNVCEKVADSGIVKLTGALIFPVLGIFI